MSFVRAWFHAFLLTLGVELCIAPWVLPKREPRWRRIGAVVAANVASHPAVWFVFPALGFRYSLYLTVAESWAFASEVAVYLLVFRGMPVRRAVAASALANGASFGLGLVLRALGVHF